MTPTYKTSFDHRVRDEWVNVEASAWADHEGIYKTRIDGVYLDGANVTGILTDFDLADIDAQIEEAIRQDMRDDADAFNPDRDAFKIGE